MDTEPIATSSPVEFHGPPRFELRRRMGMGGFGVVYEAFDRELEEIVALKTLRRRSQSDVQQLKREFRCLADVRHPNLVSLRELHYHEETWFFSMELVRGVSFLDWVWDVPNADRPTEVRVDRERLQGAVAQLAEALRALHAAGHLHRDVKPSNVMVAEGGRVVVLDFGLVTMIGAHEGAVRGGSPGYAAPETASGGPIGPESDWYSVGAMLHEVIHGHLPRPSGTLVTDDRAPVVINAGELEDLDEVARALLDIDPARRRHAIASFESSAPVSPREVTTKIIGRERELAQLDSAFASSADGTTTVAVVHGPSGIGKTRLLDAFIDSVASRAVTFSATCRDREMIPFRAFDGVVEALVQHLRLSDEGAPELSPLHAYALTRTFPAFLLIAAISRSASKVRDVPDPQTMRRLAFSAFCAIVTACARRAPVVIAIDDLQWGDSDSADLLREVLFTSVPTRLLFVLGCRSDGELPGTLPTWWNEVLDNRFTVPVAVPPLPPEQTVALVGHLVTGPHGSAIVARVVEESRGNPFFAMQLVQRSSETEDGEVPALDQVLSAQLDALTEGARSLLECLALVGRPIDCDVALLLAAPSRATRASLAEVQRTRLALLRNSGTSSVVEVAHDRLRSAVAAAVPAEDWAARHHRIAEALERIPRYAMEADLLFGLFFEARVRSKASHYAERAATRAESAFAFHQAADLYRKAAECADTEERTREMRRKLADALADGGSGAFAAPIYNELATTAGRGDAIALRQRAMEGYLTSGHVDEGLLVLRALCDELGLTFPPTPKRAFTSSLWLMLLARLRGVAIRSSSRPPVAEEAVRIDACFSAAKGLIGSDAMRGAYFSFRALDLARRAGDAERTTRYLAFVGAAILASAGGSLERWGKRMLAVAEQECERRGEPELTGTLLVCKGQVAILDGRWPEALSYSDRALEILERCRNVGWERNFAQMGALRALEELGEQNESMARVERFMREATQTGDVYARVTAAIWRGLTRIAFGETDAARADAEAAVTIWSPQGYHVQHLYSMRVQLHADLYEGKPEVAYARLERDRSAIDASFLTRVPTGRIDVTLMQARTALALARRDASRRSKLLVTIDRSIRKLRKEARPDGTVHAALLEAGACAVRGDTSRAIAHCAEARAGFTTLSMPLLAACAKHREGELAAGDAGRMLCAEAIAVMAAQGIRDPQSWLRLCAPGFAEP